MKTRIYGLPRVIVAIGVVLWGTATYGQYSNRGSAKSLTSFCGFKRGEPQKKGAEIKKAKSPFRKCRDVSLYYSKKGHLQSVDAYATLKYAPKAFRKELEDCCKVLEDQGVVFRDWNEMEDGDILDRIGYERNARAEVRIHATISKKLMTIYVGWSAVDEVPVDVDAALKLLKRGKGIKAFIETIAGEKFGTGIPENPSELIAMQLKATRNNPLYSIERVLSRPLWDMNGNITLYFWGGDKSDRKLSGISMERRDGKVRKWSDIRIDFDKLYKQVETTLGIKLSTPEEKESSMPFISKEGPKFSITTQLVSSKFEKDGLRVTVAASLSGKLPEEKNARPAVFGVKFEDVTLAE